MLLQAIAQGTQGANGRKSKPDSDLVLIILCQQGEVCGGIYCLSAFKGGSHLPVVMASAS